MRLPRPHIPLDVRIEVALRQLWRTGANPTWGEQGDESAANYLSRLLVHLAHALTGDWHAKLQLDHDPALGLREKIKRGGKIVGYRPAANDARFLLYREKHAHHIKTHVRGDGAQRSDTSMMKRERRRLWKKDPKRRKAKRRIPSRPLRSGNRWPPKGSRKIRSKAWPNVRK